MSDKEKLYEALKVSALLNEQDFDIVRRSNCIEVKGIRRFIFNKDGDLDRIKDLY
jgi:hypothetical protein